MVLLYVPPVQNLIRREVTAYASKATGMQIQVERIDLRFPLNLLVRGVEVIQQPDTLLSLESLNVRVQAWPLLKGKVEVDEVTLSRVAFNSANLIDGTIGHSCADADERHHDYSQGYHRFGPCKLESRPSSAETEKRIVQYAASR